MGQAFDRDGNMLGEAFGDTKREVLDRLEKMHPDAEAIVIQQLREKMRAGQGIKQEQAPVEPMLQWFQYAHLPPHLQEASKPFCDLATKVATEWPRNAERTVTLRKLLEAKDAAVRALIPQG